MIESQSNKAAEKGQKVKPKNEKKIK